MLAGALAPVASLLPCSTAPPLVVLAAAAVFETSIAAVDPAQNHNVLFMHSTTCASNGIADDRAFAQPGQHPVLLLLQRSEDNITD